MSTFDLRRNQTASDSNHYPSVGPEINSGLQVPAETSDTERHPPTATASVVSTGQRRRIRKKKEAADTLSAAPIATQRIETSLTRTAIERSTEPLVVNESLAAAISELRGSIAYEHNACISSMRTGAQHGLQCGRQLMAAKTLVPHGSWLQFVESTGLTARTAQRYIRLATGIERLLAVRRTEVTANAGHGEAFLTEEDLLVDVPLTRALTILKSDDAADHPPPAGQPKHGKHDWLTPAFIIAATERYLGNIECDPCATENVDNIPAERRLRPSDDGLRPDLDWGHTAFVNPGHVPELAAWVQKATRLYESRNLREALLLLPAITDASWMHNLRAFPRGFFPEPLRVEFAHSSRSVVLKKPSMLIFVGDSTRFGEFALEFSAITDVFLSVVDSAASHQPAG